MTKKHDFTENALINKQARVQLLEQLNCYKIGTVGYWVQNLFGYQVQIGF